MALNAKQKKQLVDRITKEFADRGIIIGGGWQAFVAVMLRQDRLYTQPELKELREAYYSGAQHLFASIMNILEPGTEPTEKDLDRMTLIHKELERWTEEMKQRQNSN